MGGETPGGDEDENEAEAEAQEADSDEEAEAQEAESNKDEEKTVTRASGLMSVRKQSRKRHDNKNLQNQSRK